MHLLFFNNLRKETIRFFSFFLFTLIIFPPTISTASSASSSTTYISNFGAIGDGVHDDTLAIQSALNSQYDTIIFEPGEYKITDYISLTTSNKTIIGNHSIIFTDNDYRSRDNYYEWVFNINSNNIFIKDLMFQARETILVGYKTQIGIQNAKNVTFESCYFHIPNTVYQNAQKRDIEYSNIDLYSNWHDIYISSCVILNYADTEHGVCIEFRDLKNAGCKNAYLTNSICISNCHDEIIASFSSSAQTSKEISNITIKNNYINALKTIYSSPRNVGISLGYNPNGISDVTFENNQINIYSNFTLFTIGKNQNTYIKNNIINYYIIENSSAYFSRSFSDANEIYIENNDITFIYGKNAKLLKRFYGNITFSTNIFTSK